ncbi:unnamed protein product [Auanema sp. JU1783]|nr:unnamed protein product [Auanema sp. JU1783]
MERNVMPNYSDQDTPPQKPMVRGVAQMCCWKDLPEYIKDKPFDLVYMNIEVTKGGDKMIPAIVEMANQTIGRIDLRIYFVHYNCFLMFGGYLYKHDEISDRLEEHMKTEKIIAYLVDEVEGEMCRATRYY